MVDVSAFSGITGGWMKSWIFWGIVLFALGLGMLGGLWARKRRKLKYPAMEVVPLGNGQIGLLETKAGFFRKKKTLFGLLDYGGEEEMQVKDGRKVLNASSEDFIEINGRRGPLIMRKGSDPEILVQISKMDLDQKSQTIINSIAPGDYRDAASQLIESAERETMKKWEKVIPYVIIGSLVLLVIIVLIVTFQFANNSLDKVDKRLERVDAIYANLPQSIGQEVGKAIAESMNKNGAPAPSSSAP